MTDAEIATAARRQRLERALALFPDEVAAAARLVEEQAATLVALPIAIEQGS